MLEFNENYYYIAAIYEHIYGGLVGIKGCDFLYPLDSITLKEIEKTPTEKELLHYITTVVKTNKLDKDLVQLIEVSKDIRYLLLENLHDRHVEKVEKINNDISLTLSGSKIIFRNCRITSKTTEFLSSKKEEEVIFLSCNIGIGDRLEINIEFVKTFKHEDPKWMVAKFITDSIIVKLGKDG